MGINPTGIAVAAAVVLTGALAGCDRVGNPLEAIGASVPPPDEFQVIASKPLQMPASASLPTPTPGTTSPLAPDPHRDAREALLGSSGSEVVAGQPSAGEQVLLTSATEAASSSQIRVQPSDKPASSRKEGEYEPPSILEVVGLSSGSAKKSPDSLDPQAESERLLAEGTPTTVDPDPEIDENRDENFTSDSEISEYPPGRPQSPFSKDTTIINN